MHMWFFSRSNFLSFDPWTTLESVYFRTNFWQLLEGFFFLFLCFCLFVCFFILSFVLFCFCCVYVFIVCFVFFPFFFFFFFVFVFVLFCFGLFVFYFVFILFCFFNAHNSALTTCSVTRRAVTVVTPVWPVLRSAPPIHLFAAALNIVKRGV